MIVRLVIINIILSALLPPNIGGQDVTRIVTDRKYLAKIIKAESNVISTLKEYIQSEHEKIQHIQKYVQFYFFYKFENCNGL